jgi:uncharacterized membrane protein
MNDAHLHMIFNHLPIIFPIVGILILIGGFLTRSAIVKRTAFLVFILGAIFTIPAFNTGEGAEEIVEEIGTKIDHHFIHEHEELAETFALLSYALGFISIVAFWANYTKKAFSNLIAIIVLAGSFVVVFFAQKTGTSGGEIRHTEIRKGQAAVTSDEDHDED